MTPAVWDFTSYKDYLKAWIASQPHRGHGSKAAMARAANCQTAYISQVVLGSAHLSLEQAERIAGFLELSEEEMSFFLLLIQRERAGTGGNGNAQAVLLEAAERDEGQTGAA